MTEDRMAGVPADDLDARLARYLDWESAQLRGTPSGEEIAMRIAGRAVQRSWVGSAALAWAVVAMALLAVVLAVLVAGGSTLLTVLPSPSPHASSAAPSASGMPSPSSPRIVAGMCGTGRTVITAAPSGAPVPEEATSVRAPEGGRLAIALEDQPTPFATITNGSIVVAGPEAGSARVVATFSGDEIPSRSGVGILGWEASGESLLVYAGGDSHVSVDRTCANLWIVQADGSAVTRLTDYGPGTFIGQAGISPSGASVAYTLEHVLHILDLAGGEETIPVGACEGHRMDWAPDERRLILVCGDVAVIDRDAGTRRLLPVENGVVDAVWSADGQSIVVAIAHDGAPVIIEDIDATAGAPVRRPRGDYATEWVSNTCTLSPDGRWLLLRGDVNVPDSDSPTYAVNTATGESTKLSWPVVGDTALGDRIPSVTWLEGNDRVLAANEEKLFEVDLRRLTRTQVGSVVPNQDWAVFMIPR